MGVSASSFPYNEEVLHLTQQLPSRYDSKSKRWIVETSIEEAAQYYKQNGFMAQTLQDLRRKLSGKEVVYEDLEDGRFALTMAHNVDMVYYVKLLPHRIWDKESKAWIVSDIEEEELLKYFRVVGVNIRGKNDLPPQVAQVARKVPQLTEAEVEKRMNVIPQETQCRLYMFQQEGVLFGIKHGGRIILADEMGLGKTVQAICIMAAFSEDWPLLVVCPTSLRLVWQEELQEWLPPDVLPNPDNIYTIMTRKDIAKKLPEKLPQRSIVIVSYSMAASNLKERLGEFPSIICDESHSLKDHKTKRTSNIRPAVAKSRRAVLVSGTPISSNAMQMYTQIDMVRPRLLGSRDDYGRRYGGEQKEFIGNGMYDYRGSSNVQELHAILSATMYIRRLKQEVLTELPEKQRRRVLVETQNRVELAGITAAMRANEVNDSITEEQRKLNGNVLVNKWWRATGVAKLKEAIKHLETLVEGGNKVLVFAHHSNVMDDLADALTKSKTKFVRIEGKTNPNERLQHVHKFQSVKDVKVALLSITAAGSGLTLTEANVVMFAELHWTPTELIQCEDRAHRVGQHAALQVHYVVGGEGTADTMMWQNLQKKLGMAGRILDGHGTGSATGLRAPPAAIATPIRAPEPIDEMPTPEGRPPKRPRMTPSTPAKDGSQVPVTLQQQDLASTSQPHGSQHSLHDAREAEAMAEMQRTNTAPQDQPATGIRAPRKLKPLYTSIEEEDAQPAEQPEIAQASHTDSKLPPVQAARRVPASFNQAAKHSGARAFALPPSSSACRPKQAAQAVQPSQAASAGPVRRLPSSFQDSKAGPTSRNASRAKSSQAWCPEAGTQGLRRSEGAVTKQPDSQDSVLWIDDVPSSQHFAQPAEGMGSPSKDRAAKRLSFDDAAEPTSQESQEEIIDLTQGPANVQRPAKKQDRQGTDTIATGVFALEDEASDDVEAIY